jgi:hypothetical protein
MAKKKESVDIKGLNKKVDDIYKNLSQSTDKLDDAYDDVIDYAKELMSISVQQKNLEEGIKKLKEEQNDYAELAVDLAKEGNKEQAKDSKLRSESAMYQKEIAEELLKTLAAKKEEIKFQKENIKYLKEQRKFVNENSENYKESLKFIDDISNSLSKIPMIGGILESQFDAAKEKLIKTFEAGADGTDKMKGKLSGMLVGFGVLAASAKLIELAFESNKESIALARNLGISAKEANNLHHEMQGVVLESDNALTTMANLETAAGQLASTMGTNAAITKDTLENQILLTNNMGIEATSAAALNKMFVAQGQNAGVATAEISNTVEQINEATHAGLNQKEIFEDVSKVSSTIRGTFHGNIKELTMQVVKAKQLGLTLDKIAAIGSKSLDIESSIGDEMEANVLTGRNMNLDAFRLAALKGDQKTMGEELVKQAGTLEDFDKQNILGKESLAQAFNMTVDEMRDMLETQKTLKALGVESLDKATEEVIANSNLSEEKKKQLLSDMQKQSAADAFQKSLENVKVAFTQIAEVFLPIVTGFANMVEYISKSKFLLVALVGIMGALAVKSLIVAAATAAKAVAETWGVGAIPIVAGIAATAGAVASIGAAVAINDGEIAPDGGLVVSGKKGSYQLHKDDTVIAGTGLSSSQSTTTTGAQPNNIKGLNSEVTELLKQLIAKVDQPVKISIGNRVIDELDNQASIRRTYISHVDRGYGAFG